MTARAAMIHSTTDSGRPYSDVVDKRGYWVTFRRTFSSLIVNIGESVPTAVRKVPLP